MAVTVATVAWARRRRSIRTMKRESKLMLEPLGGEGRGREGLRDGTDCCRRGWHWATPAGFPSSQLTDCHPCDSGGLQYSTDWRWLPVVTASQAQRVRGVLHTGERQKVTVTGQWGQPGCPLGIGAGAT